jgi:hypothetical protein
MSNLRTTPKERRKARAKVSAKDKRKKTEKETSMPQKESIKKLDKSVPEGLFDKAERSNCYETKVRCMTCPNCGTNWCYAHIRETSTDRYCQYCCFEDKIVGQHNAH